MRRRFPAVVVSLSLFLLSGAIGARLGAVPGTAAPPHAAQPAAGQQWQPGELSPDGVWVAEADRLLRRSDTITTASTFRTVRLRRDALRAALERARRRAGLATDDPAIVTLPTASGTFASFRLEESPVMEPALASSHPDIATFSATGVDDPATTGRLTLSSQGLHGVIVSDTGETQMIQRLGDSDDTYVVYSDRDQPAPGASQCLAPGDQAHASLRNDLIASAQSFGVAALGSGATLRTYRVAIGATGEFTQRFGGGTVNGALAAITAAINAANAVLEKEAAIRLVLVANETSIIYTDPATDGYTHLNLATMANENHNKLTTIIGEGNYDMGHVFDGDAGLAAQGYAYFGVCVNGWKDVAASIFYGVPPSDPVGLRTMLHEFGHQFNAYHSFNGTTSICGGSRNAEGAYEPGSGSSIMSYSGLCGAENVPSTALYNAGALEQIINYTSSGLGNSCAVLSATGNTPPTVDAGPNYTIPAGTPFALTATGGDLDGDPLTYSWEQFDLGTASPPITDDGTRPLFRVYNPTTLPSRMFPDLSFILSNTTAVGQTLPTTNRTLTMRVTVRDNRAGGGGVSTDEALLTVHAASGPFAVTAPNSAVSWTGETSQTVTWNPAGTAASPIAAANVRILLSTDNGQTFPTVLAASTPNDGSQSVTVPNLATTNARVKVEAIGNIFFDISNTKFTIVLAGGQPNLKIKTLVSVAAGGYVAAGAPANIQDTTQNAGTGVSAISHTRFYWSLNNTFDGGDVLLTPTAGRDVPALAPNTGSQVTTPVGIPAAAPGAYYLFAVADAASENSESNENDNKKSLPVFVGPDLAFAKMTLSRTTIPKGGAVTITLDIKNKGASLAAGSIARLYYSGDGTLNTGTDPTLDTITVGPLNAGQKITVTRTVNIPAGAASGNRFIFAKADVNAEVAEALETNNQKKAAITVP